MRSTEESWLYDEGLQIEWDIVEQFEEAYERTGKPQAWVVQEFMEEFAKQNNG